MTDIRANPFSSCTERADGVGNTEVNLFNVSNQSSHEKAGIHLSGIGLGGDGVCGRESSLFAEDLEGVSQPNY